MDQAEHLAETLEALLARRGWTPGTLARKSRVPKATIDNWLRGRATRPRAWQSIAQIAAAFELDSAETSRLFAVAGHPSVTELLELHLPVADRVLLQPWVKARSPTGSASSSNLPHGRVGDEREAAPIPVIRIPDVSPLPPGSRVHLRRNPYFVGRQQLLLTIARTLGGHDQVDRQSVDTVVLTGIGGIGKTQLATEWVHRYGQYFAGGVYWVSFADPSAIPAGVAAAGSHTFLRTFPSFGSLSLDEQVRLVWSSWHDSLPRLLIFDGCEDETLLQQWRPANGSSSVIVTSRRSHWDPLLGVRVLTLNVLERSEGIRLLRQYWPDSFQIHEELDRIAAELGDLPLAIHLAGTFLKRYQHIVTPRMYLDQLRRLEQGENRTILDHPSLLGGAVSPTAHDQNVARTFALSFEQLDESIALDSLALTTLAHAAIFAPSQRIPRHLLRASVIPNAVQPRMLYAFEDALMRVLNLGLLEVVDDGALCMHRLVAQFINASTLIVDARPKVEDALLATIAPLNEADDFRAMLALQQHVRAVTEASLTRNDRRTADLCSALGYHLWRINDLGGAERYLERAYAIREVVDINNGAGRAVTRDMLALLRQLQGRFREAQTLFEAALASWESAPEPDQTIIAVALNNLGYLSYQLGDYQTAQFYLRRSLTLAHRSLGLRHTTTARVINNVAKLSLKHHHIRHAYRLHRLTLRIREQLLAAQHLSIAQTLNDLGEVCLVQGDLEAADHYIRRALTMHENLFGDHHHGTAESCYLLGACLFEQGLFDEAYHILKRAQDIYTATLGAQHHETALATGLLGVVLFKQARSVEALAQIEHALATLRTLFGQNHPDIAYLLFLLGVQHLDRGAYDNAYVTLEQAVTIQRNSLGDGHPTTQKTQAALKTAIEHGGYRPGLERP